MTAELSTGAGSGALETPDDAGKGESGLVARWNLEWDLSSKRDKAWRKRARKALDLYRDEEAEHQGSQDESRRQRFNILYSNTETLAPSLYNSVPKPDVRRRFRDKDALGKDVAEVIERALTYSNDAEDFDAIMEAAVKDYLLPGRAVTRIRYIPTFRTMTPEPAIPMSPEESEEPPADEAQMPDDSEPYEELAFEECVCESVQWDMFRLGPGKRWSEVPWIGFEHHLKRQQAVDKFGPIAQDIQLDVTPEHVDGQKAETDPNTFKLMTVREIWDRDTKTVLFIAPKFGEKPLKVEDDPLQLEQFFPIPKPLYAIESTNTLVPVEEYRMYESQARELDRITRRINRLINGLKLRGVYDATVKEMEAVFKSDDNALIPSQDAAALQALGGLDKAVWMLPIKDAASVVVELNNQRDRLIQQIYEITGIGDIMRAQTDPRETLGAQRLKSGWGTMRLQKRQRAVQRYARDLTRLKAEVIATHFSPETLAIMTGVDMITADEKQAQIQALAAQIQGLQQQKAQAAMQAQIAQRMQPPANAPMGHNGGPPMNVVPGAPQAA
jgi:hypothetical protein